MLILCKVYFSTTLPPILFTPSEDFEGSDPKSESRKSVVIKLSQEWGHQTPHPFFSKTAFLATSEEWGSLFDKISKQAFLPNQTVLSAAPSINQSKLDTNLDLDHNSFWPMHCVVIRNILGHFGLQNLAHLGAKNWKFG